MVSPAVRSGHSRLSIAKCPALCLRSKMPCLPSISLAVDLHKPLDGAVISSLDIIREQAGWQLARAPMVSQAFAADAFSAARLICAVTLLLFLLYIALAHICPPSSIVETDFSLGISGNNTIQWGPAEHFAGSPPRHDALKVARTLIYCTCQAYAII